MGAVIWLAQLAGAVGLLLEYHSRTPKRKEKNIGRISFSTRDLPRPFDDLLGLLQNSAQDGPTCLVGGNIAVLLILQLRLWRCGCGFLRGHVAWLHLGSFS